MTTPMPPLGEPPPEELARHARAAVDWIEEYLAHPERYPALSGAAPGDAGRALDAPLDASATSWATSWATSDAAAEVERIALDWLRRLLGLGPGWHGRLTDGGPAPTMLALAAACEARPALAIRERGMAGRPDLPALRVYCSEHAHPSVETAAIASGVGRENVVRVPADDEYRMAPEALDRALDDDRARGHLPIAVVATVGTAGAASIDPVGEIAELCRAADVWLHVDAAYGGAAAVAPELQDVLDGVHLADSLLVSPDAWLFTPIDCSALYVRRPEVLRRALAPAAERGVTPEPDEATHATDHGAAFGRRFRALALWTTIRALGAEGLAARARARVALAAEFASWVRAEPGWEVVAPHPLGVVCFRRAPAGASAGDRDALNERVMRAVNGGGEAHVSPARLGGRLALRLAVGDPRAERRRVARAWELLREAASGA